VKLVLDRTYYTNSSTVGDLFIDGVWECACLEDALAVNEVKVPGQTCIPDGTYEVLITWSPRFKRRLPLLVEVPGFDGIRIHPGNTPDDTNGCLLVGEDLVWQPQTALVRSRAAFERLFAKLDKADLNGESISIEVNP
jgi:hypothetical protein